MICADSVIYKTVTHGFSCAIERCGVLVGLMPSTQYALGYDRYFNQHHLTFGHKFAIDVCLLNF